MNIGTFLKLVLSSCITVCTAAWISIDTAAQNSPTIRKDFWTTDGPVHAFLESEGTLYVGGAFSSAGPNTGGGVPVSVEGARVVPGFPRVNGVVSVVIPDGSGGWFVGGDFDTVGELKRSGLVHILRDLTVDPSWVVDVSGGDHPSVQALLIANGTLFIGGEFNSVGQASRLGLAAVEVSTGRVASWNPAVSGRVLSMAESSGSLHIGGGFSSVAGQARTNLAAITFPAGAILPWNPGASDPVLTMAIKGTNVFVGGSFTNLGGLNRTAVGVLDKDSGKVGGWTAPLNFFGGLRQVPVVRTMALSASGDVLYLGGAFNMFSSRGNRSSLAALDVSSAALTVWNPTFNSNISIDIRALLLMGQEVVVAGSFTNLGRSTNMNLAVLDAVGNGAARTNWAISAPATIQALAGSDGQIYVGGAFSTLGGQSRSNLAAFDIASGQLKSWKATTDGRVLSLAIVGSTVYAGGEFRNVNRKPRANLAGLNALSGDVLDWNVSVSGSVQAMAVRAGTLYIGGSFSAAGGLQRARLAAISTESGTVSEWNPVIMGASNPYVSSLAMRENVVYLSGNFTNVAGLARNHLAAVDAFTAKATPWNPNSDAPVNSLILAGDSVYVGGLFSRIGVQPRSGIAALQLTTGKATSWNPDSDGAVGSLAVSGKTVFAGGTFVSVGGTARRSLASIDQATGLLTGWDARLAALESPAIYALLSAGETVFVGGEFIRLGGFTTSGLCVLKQSGTSSPEQPRLTNWLLGSDGKMRFDVVPFSTSIRLQSSLDLLNWSPTTGELSTAGNYSETIGVVPTRFYRAIIP